MSNRDSAIDYPSFSAHSNSNSNSLSAPSSTKPKSTSRSPALAISQTSSESSSSSSDSESGVESEPSSESSEQDQNELSEASGDKTHNPQRKLSDTGINKVVRVEVKSPMPSQRSRQSSEAVKIPINTATNGIKDEGDEKSQLRDQLSEAPDLASTAHFSDGEKHVKDTLPKRDLNTNERPKSTARPNSFKYPSIRELRAKAEARTSDEKGSTLSGFRKSTDRSLADRESSDSSSEDDDEESSSSDGDEDDNNLPNPSQASPKTKSGGVQAGLRSAIKRKLPEARNRFKSMD